MSLLRPVDLSPRVHLFVFCVGCQYQCNQLPGKTRLRNDLLCVEWDIEPYTLTHCCFAACVLSGIRYVVNAEICI